MKRKMKYRVTLNNKVYEIEVEHGNAILRAEYDVKTPKKDQIKPTETPDENIHPEVKVEETVAEEIKTEETVSLKDDVQNDKVQNTLE